MTALLLAPVFLSTLLLSAHFLRLGHMIIVILLLCGVPLLLTVRRRWVRRLVQVILLTGALEWIGTLIGLTRVRSAMGEPFTRMAVILGAVALFTAASALLLETRRLKERYSR